ncbi:DUF2635 domain-containing protein [Bosea sp. BK604]|uniref:DUF2635 domain-containing protein n=1 Tax=Bosea sp. BK604 TaxID=2512180 RepID=UPI00104A6713|nr:DUF2635 domain-containing protein [Bosea sp. BK604]TCR60944.1 uncharacterized protein DUF2635 [Bosea sp. BK604]
MADIAVKPARKGMNLSHPVAGLLPDEGGLWPEDQFTFRRLRDRDIERVKVEAAEDKPAEVAEEVDPYPAAEEADPLELGSKRKGKA